MADRLEIVDWRLERADEHLAALKRERDAFIDEKNRLIVGHFDHEASEYVFRFGGQLPDPRLGLIIGELAYHLRAALDNLLWQIVLARGGVPTRATQFPIEECRQRYAKHACRMLRGISADDRALIEAIQPYNEGVRAADSHFALLAWLNNVDKHRFVHITCAAADTFGIAVFLSGQRPSVGEWPWYARPVRDVDEILGVTYVAPTARQDSTELMRVSIRPSGPRPKVEVHRGARVAIAVGDAKHVISIFPELDHIRGSVGQIVELFRPRLNVIRGVE